MRDGYVEGLRQMADFLEKTPEFQDEVSDYEYVRLALWLGSKEELQNVVKMLGSCEKEADDYEYRVVKRFGPHEIRVSVNRAAVCKQVPTGEKKMVKKLVDRDEYDEEIRKLRDKYIKEVEEDEMEWECPPSLLGD